jgi:hypothetical protein
MADELTKDLMTVLARHGVTSMPAAAVAAPQRPGPGTVASYIKEIITGDQAFDEQLLARVTKVLGNQR